jgi:hypothetical protein
MSNALDRTNTESSLVRGGGRTYASVSRRASRALAALEDRTIIRQADVQAEGLVQGAKTREVDHLARTAMTGQAMLARWAQTLAGGDPFIADDLKFFSDLAKMGKGEIIADTIDTYCRQGRR